MRWRGPGDHAAGLATAGQARPHRARRRGRGARRRLRDYPRRPPHRPRREAPPVRARAPPPQALLALPRVPRRPEVHPHPPARAGPAGRLRPARVALLGGGGGGGGDDQGRRRRRVLRRARRGRRRPPGSPARRRRSAASRPASRPAGKTLIGKPIRPGTKLPPSVAIATLTVICRAAAYAPHARRHCPAGMAGRGLAQPRTQDGSVAIGAASHVPVLTQDMRRARSRRPPHGRDRLRRPQDAHRAVVVSIGMFCKRR